MKKAILLLIITKLIIFLCITIAKADNETTDYSIMVEGKQISTDNQLTWTIESENEVDFYLIEFSRDAKNYNKIGEIDSKGNSENEVSYSFTHKNVESGITFYRVVQIFKNGTISYSKSIKVNSNQEVLKNSFKLFPNPVINFATMNITVNENTFWNINITDLHGNKISSAIYEVIKGNNNLNFDFSNLLNGIYLVEIIDNNGYRQTIKILKK